jgi:hypothetical protein
MQKPLDPNHVLGTGRAPAIGARFTPAEVAALDELAARRGLGRSALLRALVRDAVERETKGAKKSA